MKEFGLFDHDFKGKGMKFCCHHYPNPLPLLLRGILSLEDDISPTHFAGPGGEGVTQGVVEDSNCFVHLKNFLPFNATQRLKCGWPGIINRIKPANYKQLPLIVPRLLDLPSSRAQCFFTSAKRER